MLLPGLSLNDQNTVHASHGVSDTNAATLFTEGQSSIDGFTTYNRSYDFANYSLQNLDYNISTSRGYAGSVINMANNFTGAYYVQNNGTFVKQNFITGKIVFLAKSPLLYLRYSYLNYNGEYFGEMPYYNSSNVLKWIFIYGINPANYFEMWGYNLVNDTVINYTELNLQMFSRSNSNFQLTYVGDGNFIGIGNGESNYYVWNVYKKQLVYSSLVPFTDVEANNIYYIPQYRQYIDVFADGTTNDNLQYGTVSSSGIINSIRTIATGDTYQINGVFDIVVDVRTNNIWINDGGANYGLIVILHWNGTSFELVSSKFTSSDRKGQFNDYALENNYVPIVTANGYVQSGVGGWGSPDQFFINEFNRTSLNITGLSGNDIKWAYGMPYGNGAPIGVSLPEFNGSSLDSSYYGMWINTSSPSPHVFYVWNSSEPKSIANYIDRKEPGIYYVNIEESGLPEGSLWSYTFNRTQYALSNTSYSYALPTGNYSLHVNSIAGYNLSYPKIVVIQNKNVMVNVEFSKPKYRVTFLENGLLSGEWEIQINGGGINTKLHSINIYLANGYYKFNIL